jgi:hypothetical protein
MKRASLFLLSLAAALEVSFWPQVCGEDLKPQAAVGTDTNAPAHTLVTTNAAVAAAADLRQKAFLFEGPLLEPLRKRPDVSSDKKFAAGIKAFANWFNPLAPVPPDEPLVLATGYTFDPLFKNKSLPRAFRNEHYQEAVPLISIRRSPHVKKAAK